MRARRRLGRALQACVTEHEWEEPPPGMAALLERVDLRALSALAAGHGVGNLLYLSIRGIDGLDPVVLAGLEARYVQGVGRHLRALADLAALGEVLDARGIPWLVFKGPVLSEVVYPRADLRFYHDLDVLVPRRSFAAAVGALESAGMDLLDRNWDLLLRLRAGQVHLALRLGTLADLHWHLLNRAPLRRTLAIPSDGLIERGRRVRLGDLEVTTLDPADALVHLCVHAALAGGVRLMWLKDVERCAAAGVGSWEAVETRAREWGAAAPVAAVLARSRRLLGQGAPDEVIAALSPSSLGRAANATFDFLWPPERSRGAGSPAALWVRYRRDRVSRTASALLGRLESRWRTRSARAGIPSDLDAVPAFIPSGGDATREAFFRTVAGNNGGPEALGREGPPTGGD